MPDSAWGPFREPQAPLNAGGVALDPSARATLRYDGTLHTAPKRLNRRPSQRRFGSMANAARAARTCSASTSDPTAGNAAATGGSEYGRRDKPPLMVGERIRSFLQTTTVQAC